MIGSDWEVAPDILYPKYLIIHKKTLFLSSCKINQNMEFGDIIYLILLIFLMILGFFNDSRKKKTMQQKQEGSSTPFFPAEEEEPFLRHTRERKKTTLPSPVPTQPATTGRTQFRSSLDLVTDFEGESSLKSSIFVYDADASFGQESAFSDPHAVNSAADANRPSLHPFVADLLEGEREDKLKKGLIYGEIMQRKY